MRSQWAGVKVLQQQLFAMGSMLVMIVATWVYKVRLGPPGTSFWFRLSRNHSRKKTIPMQGPIRPLNLQSVLRYLLQTCWRKAIFIAIVAVTIIDSIPTFLTIFGVVRDQYFFLGEEIASAVPTTALALIYSLMVIELAEPGQEGLCYGLIGTVQHASLPIATALSNQIFGLFKPSLSLLENYVTDTPAFRSTVAWSYVLTYAASLLGMCALPLVPRQKADVQRRKREPRLRTLHSRCLLQPYRIGEKNSVKHLLRPSAADLAPRSGVPAQSWPSWSWAFLLFACLTVLSSCSSAVNHKRHACAGWAARAVTT